MKADCRVWGIAEGPSFILLRSRSVEGIGSWKKSVQKRRGAGESLPWLTVFSDPHQAVTAPSKPRSSGYSALFWPILSIAHVYTLKDTSLFYVFHITQIKRRLWSWVRGHRIEICSVWDPAPLMSSEKYETWLLTCSKASFAVHHGISWHNLTHRRSPVSWKWEGQATVLFSRAVIVK